MNIKKVINYIGVMLMTEAILMLLPFVCALAYREIVGKYFLMVAIPLFIFGFILNKIFTSDDRFYTAEGFATASIGWILLSVIGALPFFISGSIPSYIDALFETVSGFTTTGATLFDNASILPKCMNFWRCFTHFIGGMGILVLVLAILPSQSENMQIMQAEAPGPQVGKLVPKASDTAKTLYIIYVALTLCAIISYKLSGMPLFDSICIGFGTAGTGGFVVTEYGCAEYSTLSQFLISIFMIIFGVNFNIYYLMYKKKLKNAFLSEELRVYVCIIVISVLLIAINIYNYFGDALLTFHHTLFQVASVMTTTGFSTADFDLWPMFSKHLLVVLMVIGGMAGSTAGGFKVSRIIIAIKASLNELYLLLHPNSVKVVKFEDKAISSSLVRTVNSYAIIYFLFIVCGIIAISIENFDFTTTFVSVIETFNNIGVGLSKVGPMGNFSIFSIPSKIVFIILMLTGRLEIFPIIMLLSKKTWRREQ